MTAHRPAHRRTVRRSLHRPVHQTIVRRQGRRADVALAAEIATSQVSNGVAQRLRQLVLGAGLLVLPLIFVVSLEDTFALPKFVVLCAVGSASLVLLAMHAPSQDSGPVLADLLVVALVVGNLVAFLFSIDRGQSLFGERLQYQGLLAFVAYAAAYYLARTTSFTDRTVVGLLSVMTLAASLVAAYALVQRAGLDPIWDSLLRDRTFSTFGQPNALAAYLVLVLPIAAALLWWVRGSARAILIGALVLMVTGLLTTQSRGGLAGLAAGATVLTIVLWLSGWSGNSRRYLAAGGLVLTVVAASVLAAPMRGAIADYADRVRVGADPSGFEARQLTALWEVGVAIAVDRPLTGGGQDTYPLLFDDYRDEVLDPYRASVLAEYRPESPHSAYVGVAAAAGFPTLAAYLALLAAAVVMLWRAAVHGGPTGRGRLAAGLLAGVVGYAVADAFRTPDVAGTWVLWTVLGLSAALYSRPASTAETATGALVALGISGRGRGPD